MARLILLLLLLFTLPALQAQTPMFKFGDPLTASGTMPFPFGASAIGSRGQTVYNSGSFGGGLSGQVALTRLYFYADTLASDTITYSTMVITLGEMTTAASLGFAWMAPPANAVQVVNATNIQVIRDSGWFFIDLPVPYLYNTSTNLFVDFRVGAQTPYSKQWLIKTTSGVGFIASANPAAGSPNNIYGGATPIMGFDIFTGQNNASLSKVTMPSVCANNQDIQVKIGNSGTNPITSVTVEWTANGIAQTPLYYNGSIDSFGSGLSDTIVTLGNVSFISGAQNIKAWVSSPNSGVDPFRLNDTITFSVGSAFNGTYTIGSSGNFTSITDAVNALTNYGVCGPVTFVIDSGTYFSQVNISGRINGASPTNTITFKGIDRDKTIFSWAALAVNSKHVIRLQNTAYITLRDLTIKPTGAVNAWGLHLIDSCKAITVKNCVFDISSAANSTGATATVGITVSGNAAGICIPAPCASPLNSGTRSDSLEIDSNTFLYGYSAINIVGTAALKGRYNKITNNTILRAYQNSINLSFQENVQVEHNRIFTGGAAVTNMGTGIFCSNVISTPAPARSTISRNRISGYTTAGISIATSVNTDSSNKALITNNMIGGLEQSPDGNGLIIADSKNWSVANNTINRDFSGTTAATASGIRVLGTSSRISIVNNVISISKAGLALPVYILDTANIDTMDRNVFYRKDISNNQVLNMNGTNYLLSNYKGAKSFNTNSNVATVSFKNDTNLSLQQVCGFPAGMPLSYVKVDIDSNTRNTPPMVGAEEAVPFVNNIMLVSVRQPVSPLTTGPQTMNVVIRNLGSAPLSTFNLSYQFNGYTPVTQPVTLGTPLNTCDTAVVTVSGLSFAAGDTMIRMTVYTDFPNTSTDAYPANDTLRVKLYNPLIGVYTLGGPSADFASFTDAAYALKTAGIKGAVTFVVNPGTYTEQLTITGPIAGASPANSITFDGVDNTTRTLSFAGNAGSKHTVQLDNAKYVTIRNLGITTTGSLWGYAVHITNGSNRCRIKKCTITISGAGSASTSANFNGITVSGAAPTTATRIDSLEIDSNNISYGYYGISIYASSGAANIGQFNKIRNNTILNAQQYSVYLVYQQTPEVLNNMITCRGANAGVGIYCQNLTTPATGLLQTSIIGNRISNYGAAGISMNSCTNASNLLKGRITNNVVGGQEKTADAYGVYLTSSTNWSIANNTINRDFITTTTETSAALRIQGAVGASFGNTIVNNVLALSGNGTSLPLYTQVAGNTDTIDYNLYYRADTTTTATVAFIGAAVTLNTLKTGTFNKNSVYYRPGFTSAADLTPNPADSAVWSVNGRGTYLGYVKTDFTAKGRPLNFATGAPDLGAYEFTPTSLPPRARAIPDTIIGGTVQTFTFATDTVARILWPVSYSGSSAVEIRQFSGERPQHIDTLFNYMYFYDRISNLPAQPDSLLVYYRENWKGTHATENGIKTLLSDTSSSSWSSQFYSATNPVRNIIGLSYYANYNSYAHITGGDGALVPVKMLSFKGQKQNHDAHLTWVTASEKNVSRFELQRSADRKSWTAISVVKARGNSSVAASYEYTDAYVFKNTSGTVYYRLKMIDNDGSSELSTIVAIAPEASQLQAGNTYTAFPNPFNSELHLQLETKERADVAISISDITGKEIYSAHRLADEQNNLITLTDLPALNTGIYLMQVTINGTVQTTQKLIRN